MRVIKSFFIAISMYSQIPVPQFAWEEGDMGYVFCFFPWVGALIGICVSVWNALCIRCQIGDLCRAAIGIALPLLVTGGIHVDGFMDTMDALHSYGTKEKKLAILKDPHSGAFAVILLAMYGLIYFGAFSEIKNDALLSILCGGFFFSRCLCGISAVSFPLAKKEGTLSLFANCSRKKIVKGSLYLQGIGCVGWMLFWSLSAGLLVAGTAVFLLLFYFWKSKKEFGGITGDTAGYFVVISEVGMAVAAAVFGIWVR